MNASAPVGASSPGSTLAATYGALFERLLPGLIGGMLFDRELCSRGTWGRPLPPSHLPALLAPNRSSQAPLLRDLPSGDALVLIPFLDSHGASVGAVALQISSSSRQKMNLTSAKAVVAALGPGLDCLHREFLHQKEPASVDSDRSTLERTQDLEWLFNVADGLKSSGESDQLKRLLGAACERMECSVGIVNIPGKKLSTMAHAYGDRVPELRDSASLAEPHLLSWAMRRREMLMVNEPPRPPSPVPPIKFVSVPLLTATGRVLGVLAFFRAADGPGFTDRQQYLAGRLASQVVQVVESQFDLMTGLPIRSALEQRFDTLCTESPGVGRSLLYLDIDELHICNETHGFELGDEIIVRLAQTLTSGILPDDRLVARISADSFAAIIDDADPKAAAQVAVKLQAEIRKIRIGPEQDPVKVSVSCGVAAIVDMPKGFARALAAAELACKAAKDRGRDRVEVYACEDSSMMRRHDDVIVVGQLREAIRQDRLVLHAQPIVSLQDDRSVAGFEVLLRLRNEDGSLIMPGKFLSAAQRYHLLPQIDRQVLRQTLEIAGPYSGVLRELGATLSVNITGQSIVDESFVDFMLSEIRESRIAPGLINCEITEQTAASSLAKAAKLMTRLREAGCGVALDDFGVGANTFAYLKGLPVTRIKIDGSFVVDMLSNARSAAMVKSLVALAKQFELETVAEFVEDETVAEALRKIGVDYGQGYAFGKPIDMETVLKNLRDEESKRMRALWLAQ